MEITANTPRIGIHNYTIDSDSSLENCFSGNSSECFQAYRQFLTGVLIDWNSPRDTVRTIKTAKTSLDLECNKIRNFDRAIEDLITLNDRIPVNIQCECNNTIHCHVKPLHKAVVWLKENLYSIRFKGMYLAQSLDGIGSVLCSQEPTIERKYTNRYKREHRCIPAGDIIEINGLRIEWKEGIPEIPKKSFIEIQEWKRENKFYFSAALGDTDAQLKVQNAKAKMKQKDEIDRQREDRESNERWDAASDSYNRHKDERRGI